MKRISTLFFIITLLLSAGCSGINADGDGVTVKTGDGNLVRLEAVSDSIIRVSATCDGKFSDRASLSVLPVGRRPEFKVSKTDSTVTLSTAEVNATICRSSGRVSFSDTKGNPILAEERREFSPIEADGDRGWSVRQIFASHDGEAFYGLGQHQSDEFNYKGKNETLYQYNTKISVPFIVSSLGYGILWDNYSLTRWGDPRDYAELNSAFVTEGFKATYTAEDGSVFTRNEKFIDYSDLEKIKNFPEETKDKFEGSTIVWEGDVIPQESGTYRFLLYYAGYTKVFADGREVMPEHWRTAWNPNNVKFNLEMTKGEPQTIRIEWKPDGGQSFIALKALTPVDPAEQAKMSWWSEMGDQIDYYFVYGGNADRTVRGYRRLTGKSPVLPEWAMGFWQSRQRYRTQDELLSTVKGYRDRNIGLDMIVMDWFYWREDDWGGHVFDSARFENPKAMLDSVHAMDAHLLLSVWPKFYLTTKHFKELDAIGGIYRRAVEDSLRDWVGKGYMGSFYDAYNPDARKLYWKQISETLLPLGIDAWWLDSVEPDIQSNHDINYRKALCGPTYLGSSTRYFNAYPLMNAKAVYDGLKEDRPEKRPVILTRSGFAGSQRYNAIIWSGDIGTCWEDMKAQISAGLNFSMSGLPYWTQDIGGFCVKRKFFEAKEGTPEMDEWRELNVRWHQWGMFAPIYRSHGEFPYREVWNIAPEWTPAFKSITDCISLRYRLMPYIYSLAARTYLDDYTIMRPLVMDFADDAMALDISDQFMFGDSFMVCPVYTYKARSREVYLPEGGWYDYSDGKFIEGGKTFTADAPYDRSPLYVRAGSIIPMGPDIKYAMQPDGGKLDIIVYAGADGTFSLYNDDGDSCGYEKGEYSIIPMKWNDDTSSLVILDREGSYKGMKDNYSLTVTIFRPEGGRETKTASYDGKAVNIQF